MLQKLWTLQKDQKKSQKRNLKLSQSNLKNQINWSTKEQTEGNKTKKQTESNKDETREERHKDETQYLMLQKCIVNLVVDLNPKTVSNSLSTTFKESHAERKKAFQSMFKMVPKERMEK